MKTHRKQSFPHFFVIMNLKIQDSYGIHLVNISKMLNKNLKNFFSGMMISILFLIITLAIYAFIPELRNLHGKCMMSYITALILLFICLSTIQFDLSFLVLGSNACYFAGYLAYFSVMLCFCWLTIMCFDVWKTYKCGIAPMSHTKEQKTFSFYSILGFGIPLILTLLILFIDKTQILPESLQPSIGTRRCFVRDSRLIEAIYVYIPITLLCAINITLFLLTANKMKHARNVAVDEALHSRMNAAKYRFGRDQFY